MEIDPLERPPNELGVFDETAFATVGPSGTRFLVSMQRPSISIMLANFTGLYRFDIRDLETIDALLAYVLGRAFSITAIDELILSADGEAERVFTGLAPIEHNGIAIECRVSRERYTSLKK